MHDSFDWATFAFTAFGALGTVAALIVAIVVGSRQLGQFRTDQKQRDLDQKQRDNDARRQQARCVSAILRVAGEASAHNHYQLGPKSLPAAERLLPSYPTTCEVMNASPWPIYEAAVQLHGASRVWLVGFVPGGENGHAHVAAQTDRKLDGCAAPHLYFRDAAGVWWTRTDEGDLFEVEGRPFHEVSSVDEGNP
ncbi:hypothetical protein [Flexivirga sp.]|uniref:hypothetical protein n=1 Tax=Flexivirga sp. TaxID=1962927 RepID=UPI003F7FA9E7